MAKVLSLTIGPPDGPGLPHVDAEDHGHDDDGGQGGLWNVGKGRHEEPESQQNHAAGKHAGSSGADAAGRVDGGATEGAGDRHPRNKGAQEVAQTEREQLLTGVYRLVPS